MQVIDSPSFLPCLTWIRLVGLLSPKLGVSIPLAARQENQDAPFGETATQPAQVIDFLARRLPLAAGLGVTAPTTTLATESESWYRSQVGQWQVLRSPHRRTLAEKRAVFTYRSSRSCVIDNAPSRALSHIILSGMIGE